jgi:hypothetical protein
MPKLSRREFVAYLASSGLLLGCKGGAKKRVLVVGAGLGGLSAAIHLLEEAGDSVHVDLIHQGHLLGGKATSWMEGDYRVGHGFHVLFGFYEEMLGLLERCGMNFDDHLLKNAGKLFFYEDRDQKVYVAGGDVAHYPGFTAAERSNLTTWLLHNFGTISNIEEYPELDEISFDDWALKTGMHASLLATNFFRYARDVIFNYPEPISAYIVAEFMRTGFQLHGTHNPADVYYANGDMVESFIKPLATYFKKLGGNLTPRLKVRRLLHSGSRVTGVEVAEPDPPSTHCATGDWPGGAVSVNEDTSHVLDAYDAYVVAMPYETFLELNPGDKDFWSDSVFSKFHNLRGAASLSCRFWCNSPVGTERYAGVLNGMPEPVPTVMDWRHVLKDADSRWAATLDCCGPLAGYEHMDDDTLISLIGERLGKVPGLKNPLECDLDRVWFRRNDSRHGRLLIPVPGGLKYRPYPATSLDNLWLAGDWVRNSFEIPTMEGAARSGKDAALQLLRRIG